MGASCCCFSSGGSQGHRVVEERVPLSPNIGDPPTFSMGLQVDTNLETQTIEIYRPPPLPVPYDVDQGRVQSPPATQEIGGDKNGAGSRGREPESDESSTHSTTGSTENIEELNKSEINIEIALTEKLGIKLSKSVDDTPFVIEEEDVCPTCLEEYDDENPKMMTKCDHHFHLSCILEWKERSETCPVCDQVSSSPFETNLTLSTQTQQMLLLFFRRGEGRSCRHVYDPLFPQSSRSQQSITTPILHRPVRLISARIIRSYPNTHLIGGFCASPVNFFMLRMASELVVQLDKINPRVGLSNGFCLLKAEAIRRHQTKPLQGTTGDGIVFHELGALVPLDSVS